MRKISRFKKGFTFIELILSISIMAILASTIMVLINPLTQFKKARDGQRKSDLRGIQSALEMYRAEQGRYPNSLKNCPVGGVRSATDLGNPPACTVIYKKNVPDDPLNNAVYSYSSNGTIYCLRACLENVNDSQKDSVNNPPITGCTLANCAGGTTNWSYTLQNP